MPLAERCGRGHLLEQNGPFTWKITQENVRYQRLLSTIQGRLLWIWPSCSVHLGSICPFSGGSRIFYASDVCDGNQQHVRGFESSIWSNCRKTFSFYWSLLNVNKINGTFVMRVIFENLKISESWRIRSSARLSTSFKWRANNDI